MNNINGFSVITITKRRNEINNLIQNYKRQLFNNKELIIVINNDDILIEEYSEYINSIDNIKIFKLSQYINLGQCLNFAVENSSFKYIAKFDDDDYYSKYYLNEIYKAFEESACMIVGKFKVYYYLEEINSLCEVTAKSDNYENQLTYMLKGSTICFEKQIFSQVRFSNNNLGEDSIFCRECTKKGYKIYATSKYNHIVFRDKLLNNHTWKEKTQFFLNLGKVIYNDITFDECKLLVEKEF